MWSSVSRIIAFGSVFSALRMLVGAISAAYLLTRGLTLADIGMLKTTQALAILFLDVPLAYLADKYSRRLSVSLAVLSASIWLILTAAATSNWMFYLAECFNALSLALISGALISYLIDVGIHQGDSSGIHKVIGRYQRAQFFIMGISAFVGSAFIATDSSTIWYVAGISCLVLFSVFSWVLPADNIKRGESGAKSSSFINDLRTSLLLFRQNEGVLLAMAMMMLIVMAFYQVLIQFWQPLSFSAYDALPEEGIYFGTLFGFILLGQSFASWGASKIDSTRLLLFIGIVGSLATVVGLVLGLLIWPWLVPITIILVFATNRTSTIAIQGMFHEQVPSETRATFDSFVSAVLRLCLLIVMPLMGYSVQRYGWGVFVAFYVVTVALCLMIVTLRSLKRKSVRVSASS